MGRRWCALRLTRTCANRGRGRPLNRIVRQHVKFIFDRRTAVLSDRVPFMRMCGNAGAVLYVLAYVPMFAVGPSDEFDWRFVGFLAAGAVVSWFFWGFGAGALIWDGYFRPAIESRDGKRAA